MSDRINDLIARVIKREGGSAYTNDPDDAGGPTKYGVTLATLHNYRKQAVSAADVQALTEAEAVQIYRSMYFPAGFEKIENDAVLEELFDYGVNSGPGASVSALQTVLKREGLYDGAIDGSFGPKSAAGLAKIKNWPALFYAIKCERYELLLRYIGRSPSQSKYAIGWANRLDTIESPIA
jgi:lysozyme family protein